MAFCTETCATHCAMQGNAFFAAILRMPVEYRDCLPESAFQRRKSRKFEHSPFNGEQIAPWETDTLAKGAQSATGDSIMGNALVWMLGISASVIGLAYLIILAVILAAKRRMAIPAGSRNDRSVGNVASMSGMRYRTP